MSPSKNGQIGDRKKWLDVYDPKIDMWNQLTDAPRASDCFLNRGGK